MATAKTTMRNYSLRITREKNVMELIKLVIPETHCDRGRDRDRTDKETETETETGSKNISYLCHVSEE